MDWIDKLTAQLPLFAITLVRVGCVLYLIPVFGKRSMPAIHQVWLVGFLSFLMLPVASTHWTGGVTGFGYVPLVAREAAVGMLMGFIVLLVLESARYAGRISGVHIGFGLAAVMDPVTKEQGTLIDQLQGLMVIVLFLLIGGHRVLIAAIGTSFSIVPIGRAELPPELAESFVRLFCHVIILGIKIASPVLASVFLSEAAIGILARSVPQLNIFTVGLPLRIILGLSVLMATLPMFLHLMRQAIENIPLELQGLFLQLAP